MGPRLLSENNFCLETFYRTDEMMRSLLPPVSLETLHSDKIFSILYTVQYSTVITLALWALYSSTCTMFIPVSN